MIQFKENAWTGRRMEGQMDRPYFTGPFRLPPRVQKSAQSSKVASMKTCWNTAQGRKKRRTYWLNRFKLFLHRGINTRHNNWCNAVCMHVTYTIVTIHAICEGLEIKNWVSLASVHFFIEVKYGRRNICQKQLCFIG